MYAKKLGLVKNENNYELVNTDLFPYDKQSKEECKKNLISDDLLKDIEIAKQKKNKMFRFNDHTNLIVDKTRIKSVYFEWVDGTQWHEQMVISFVDNTICKAKYEDKRDRIADYERLLEVLL